MNASMYAHGGRLKRGKMVIAHFNPRELNVLDELQGKKETCPRSGMRSYSHLEELLKNPHLLRGLVNQVEQHVKRKAHARGGMSYAEGGHPHDYHSASLNRLADGGIRGDTEIALIGPHTKNVLDNLVAVQGYPVDRNPNTGHPHYGFLDGIVSGLGNVLGKIPIVGNLAKNAVSGIGNLVGKILPGLAPAAGQLAQQYLPQLGERLGGQTGANLAGLAGQFINQATQQGASPEQLALGQQIANQASSLGQNAYNAYQQGGMQNVFRQGGAGALNQLGQYLPSEVQPMMGQVAQGIQRGQGAGQIFNDVRASLPSGPPINWGSVANRAGQYAGDILGDVRQGRGLEDIARSRGSQALREVGGYAPKIARPLVNQVANAVQRGESLPSMGREVMSAPGFDMGQYDPRTGDYVPGELFG